MPRPKQPGAETLLARVKRGLLGGYDGEETAVRSANPPPQTVKGWSENLAAISTGVLAIATLASWFFGSAHGFPNWVLYILTLFVGVAVYKYSETHVRKLLRFLSLRRYLRQQRFRLVDCIQGFGDLTSMRLDTSVTTVIRKIAERNGQAIVDPDLFGYPEQFLANSLLRLSDAGSRITISEFKGVLNDLSTLIRFCSYFFFRKPLQEDKLSILSQADRNSLEAAREDFADFVRRFQVFHDEVQLRMRSGTRARFDVPRPV